MRKAPIHLAATAASFVLLVSPAAAHLVQPGESLWSIAQANGVSAAQLAAANGLGAESQLIAGTTITVPYGANAVTHNSYSANPQTTNERYTAGQVGDIGQQTGMSRSLVQGSAGRRAGSTMPRTRAPMHAGSCRSFRAPGSS